MRKISIILTAHNSNAGRFDNCFYNQGDEEAKFELWLNLIRANNPNIDFYPILCTTKSFDITKYWHLFKEVICIDNSGHHQGEKHLMTKGFQAGFDISPLCLKITHIGVSSLDNALKCMDEGYDAVFDQYWDNAESYSTTTLLATKAIYEPWKNTDPVWPNPNWQYPFMLEQWFKKLADNNNLKVKQCKMDTHRIHNHWMP